MIWKCALRWAAVLTLVAMVVIAPLPARLSAPIMSALAQSDIDADAGEPLEPTDLAVAALHCAEAPAAEALTAFFSTGATPGGCSPAVGVTISVSEDGVPSSGSPAATDVNGIAVLPVSLGSAVEVREDPESLPDGYAPLTQDANGVPYANPVQIDSAVAGAAVLFVNVPRSVAAERAQEAPAAEMNAQADLSVLALQCAAAPAPEALTTFFSTGTPPGRCAPAADVRIAITENEQPLPGSPFTTGVEGALSVPVRQGAAVSVTEDLDSLPAGYEPLTQRANGVPYANPVELGSATADTAVLFVNVPAAITAELASAPLAAGNGVTDLAQANTRVVPVDRGNADSWYAARARTNTSVVAIVRNPTSIANGVWCWPDRFSRDDWVWRQRNLRDDRDRSLPNTTYTGNVAIVSNPVFINKGAWGWPDRHEGGDWSWRNRAGHSVWSWRNWFNLGNITVARSGNGNIAIVSNPVSIGRGIWHWPGHLNAGGWPGIIRAGNLVIARSGDNIAIVSNPVVIANGLWYLPPARDHDWYDHHDDDDEDWDDHHDRDHDGHDGDHDDTDMHLLQGGDTQADQSTGEALAINDGEADEEMPVETASLAATEQPALSVNGEIVAEPELADAVQAPAGDAVTAPAEVDQPASDGDVALPSGGTVEATSDGTVAEPADSADQPQATTDAPAVFDVAPDPGYVAPDSGYVAPDPVYVAPDPAVEPAYVDPGYVNPGYVDPGSMEQAPVSIDAGADTGYVAPEPSYVEPMYAAPDDVATGSVDVGYVAPDPVIAPSYSEPQPVLVDPGFSGADIAPASAAAMPEPVYAAPEPNSIDAGNSNAGAGNMAPDHSMSDAGSGDPGVGTADSGGGDEG